MDWSSISIAGRTVLAILYIVSAILTTRYCLHLLQSGAYRPGDYFRHLADEPFRWLPLIFVIIPVAMLILRYSITGFITGVAYFTGILLYYGKAMPLLRLVPEHPFQATHRVWRLTAAIGLFWLTLILTIVWIPRPARTPILILVGIWFALQPTIVAAAELLNVPVEKQVRQYYTALARRKISSMKDLQVIGVTGSYGKTTVKDAIAQILSIQYRVCQTPGSYNTRMGLARTVNEKLRKDDEIFVCEMGARQVGEIEELCDMVRPTAGIITAIGNRHLDTFHSVRNIVKTRYELLDAVDAAGGQMFVNGDNMLIRQHMRYPDAITYGFSRDCSYHGALLSQDITGSTFSVTGPDGQYGEYHTRLLGRYNLVDLMGAIAVANRSGIPMENMVSPIAALEPSPHRLYMTMTGRRAVIDDTDNSYPDAVAVSLETLSMFERLRILVTPGLPMREPAQDEILQFGARAALSADYVILVGHLGTHEIYESIIETGFRSDHIFLVDTMADARILATQIEPDKDSVILLENSLPRK